MRSAYRIFQLIAPNFETSAATSTIVFPTLAMEREHRSLGSGSVSTNEFQECMWEGLKRVVEQAHAAGERDEVLAVVYGKVWCLRLPGDGADAVVGCR